MSYAHPPASDLRNALATAEYLAWGGVIGIEPGFLGNQPGTLVTLQLGDHTANLPPVVRMFLSAANFRIGNQSLCVAGQRSPALPVAIDDAVFILLPAGRAAGDDLYLPATDLEFITSPSAMVPAGYPRESQFTIDEFNRAFDRSLREHQPSN